MKQFKKSLIKQLLVKQHESKNSWNQLAKRAKISPSIISKFLHTEAEISAESLNKLLNLFNVDLYEASCLSLKKRNLDIMISLPVCGVANSQGIIEKPRLSDPAYVNRSNIWRGYNVVISKYDPVYDWQLLINKDVNFAENKINQIVFSVIYFMEKGKKIARTANIISSKNGFLCTDYPSYEEHFISKKDMILIRPIESAFAPITTKNFNDT